MISYFANRLISKSNRFLPTEVEWPPRSPDLTKPDFFLWGHLKNNFYSSKPRNLEELRLNVTNEIQKISVETLHKVSENMVNRVRLCLAMNGGHFQQLL
jgi:hypothetical protein